MPTFKYWMFQCFWPGIQQASEYQTKIQIFFLTSGLHLQLFQTDIYVTEWL